MAEASTIRQRAGEYMAIGAVYGGFFMVAFAFSAYLTFPYDRLRDYLIAKVEEAGKGRSDRMTVEIGSLAPSFFTGAVLTDVELTRHSPDGAPSVLSFDEVRARVSPWSLLVRAPKVSVLATVGDGELDAVYTQDTDQQTLEAEIDALDVGELGLGSFLGVPMEGRASGTIDLTIAAEPQKTTGEIDLKIAGLRIGDGKAKLSVPGLRSGMTLEQLDAGTLDLAIKAENGSAQITRLTTDGKDLKIKGDGSLRLATPFRRSRPDIVLELRLSEAYKNKTDRTKALFEILSMQPDWQRATQPDGAMNLHLGGTVQSIRATPGASRSARKK